MTADTHKPLNEMVMLVTGGTGGIGKATATGLARSGARVGIVGRDRSRAHSAAADIRRASQNDAIDVFPVDLSIQADVRSLATEVLNRYDRLDVLISNVGGSWRNRRVTTDGIVHVRGQSIQDDVERAVEDHDTAGRR